MTKKYMHCVRSVQKGYRYTSITLKVPGNNQLPSSFQPARAESSKRPKLKQNNKHGDGSPFLSLAPSLTALLHAR